LTFECDLDLGTQLLQSAMVIACAKLFQISGLKVMKQTRNVDCLLWNEDIFNMTFNCNLDIGVATKFLHSAHSLIMVITCAKLFQKKNQRLKCYEADKKEFKVTDRQTDGQMDWQTEAIPIILFLLRGRGLINLIYTVTIKVNLIQNLIKRKYWKCVSSILNLLNELNKVILLEPLAGIIFFIQ
jgi:hypothetical protein